MPAGAADMAAIPIIWRPRAGPKSDVWPEGEGGLATERRVKHTKVGVEEGGVALGQERDADDADAAGIRERLEPPQQQMLVEKKE